MRSVARRRRREASSSTARVALAKKRTEMREDCMRDRCEEEKEARKKREDIIYRSGNGKGRKGNEEKEKR